MIQEQGVGGQLLLLLNPKKNNEGQLAKKPNNTPEIYCLSFYHLERRRDFPEPGPPDTSKGGVGGGAAIMSFNRSIYYDRETVKKRKLGAWKTTFQTRSGWTLPSESLTGRWCCCRPAGRTRFVPARHAHPKGHLQSLLHTLPLTLNPLNQVLHFQGRATPTWWRSNLQV